MAAAHSARVKAIRTGVSVRGKIVAYDDAGIHIQIGSLPRAASLFPIGEKVQMTVSTAAGRHTVDTLIKRVSDDLLVVQASTVMTRQQRRRGNRQPCRVACTFRDLDQQEGGWLDGEIHDISHGGMKIVSPNAYEAGACLVVKYCLFAEDIPVVATGEITHQGVDDKGQNYMGLKFLHAPRLEARRLFDASPSTV
ncbi:MAG: PilZ domain-containing protein [Armatimonadetes bacterium]|nr:PilZ domain-containing protein [Armatimonadota bacterium]